MHNTFTVKIFKDNKAYDYELSPMSCGRLYLTNQDGEGMEIDGVKFWELLDKFWKDTY